MITCNFLKKDSVHWICFLFCISTLIKQYLLYNELLMETKMLVKEKHLEHIVHNGNDHPPLLCFHHMCSMAFI